ncbi:hypothetical protein FOA43_004074 [Brettanomyces nanus]|uniref:Uncharacterized protein n=1 Tax=Eeniella nana TaxID=13502 RepID=A0A875RQE3_EENNA|nr:uncharacterized protein FOA43_004074 [Brettanomyces nanus]QPG76680.1 hypothetical protein FOA43_004074 [Brettanomyces nanus]
MGVLVVFIMTRISFSFRFQSLLLISLILAFFLLATALNMIWLLDARENMKWLVGAYSLLQLISVNLVYELLANWKLFDRKAENRGIVGREVRIVEAAEAEATGATGAAEATETAGATETTRATETAGANGPQERF